MSDDWAKRDRRHAKRAIKDMNAARNFPDGTCPASRHVAMIAETLAKGKQYHMLDSDREHCATSMAQTVKALWECRAKLAQAVETLQWQADAIRKSISANHVEPHRILLNGVYHEGPVANWAYEVLTGFETINRTVLAELKGGEDGNSTERR